MDDLWAYPYRMGIGIFLVVGTLLLTAALVVLSIWLEKDFKKDNKTK